MHRASHREARQGDKEVSECREETELDPEEQGGAVEAGEAREAETKAAWAVPWQRDRQGPVFVPGAVTRSLTNGASPA